MQNASESMKEKDVKIENLLKKLELGEAKRSTMQKDHEEFQSQIIIDSSKCSETQNKLLVCLPLSLQNACSLLDRRKFTTKRKSETFT